MNTIKSGCGNCVYCYNGQCALPLKCKGAVPKTMTNRQWLNTLSDEEFVSVVLAKEAELHEKNFDDELDIFDIAVGEQLDFKQWLGEEHKE